MRTTPDLASVLDRIRGWAEANNWKPATLARRAGLAESVTRDMDNAGWAPSSNSIRRFEALIPEGWRVGDDLPTETAVSEAATEAASAGPASERASAA
jgi:hypothetical protein